MVVESGVERIPLVGERVLFRGERILEVGEHFDMGRERFPW
ncbi:hypothetical protein SAMN05216225_10045, partial [Ornithinibacillus halophilus]